MRVSHPRIPLLLFLAPALGGCLAAPPRERIASRAGVVRAATQAEAEEVSALLGTLSSQVVALLPDAEIGSELEVWLQEEPGLYRFPAPASGTAEGLWSANHARILLSSGAEDLERTLAHELVHAALGDTWRTLPGSLEEGLCDVVSARVSNEGAPRLRAGRLSSAALACGGLGIELEVRESDGSRRGWTARIVLSGDEPARDPLAVFRVQAGLSSTRLRSGVKRSYYGLSFLVVERVVERVGLEGLHELCLEAGRQGLSQVPHTWLLEAAELSSDPEEWRRAAVMALGPLELRELFDMYPEFAVDAVAQILWDTPAAALDERLGEIQAWMRLSEGSAEVEVSALPELRRALRARAAERSSDHPASPQPASSR